MLVEPFVNYRCGDIFACCLEGFRLSNVQMSYGMVKASPLPSVAQQLKFCFFLVYCVCLWNRKSVSPTFDRPIGRSLGFGNLVVIIVFRFDGGLNLGLLVLILIWAHSAFYLFAI
jgi:hypothetical protein